MQELDSEHVLIVSLNSGSAESGELVKAWLCNNHLYIVTATKEYFLIRIHNQLDYLFLV